MQARSAVPAGFLNIDKPAGITSFDVVRALRRASGIRRVGHAGTLDPLATGVLPVALGEATRLIEALTDATKRYTAAITFGVETDTDDAEGVAVATHDASGLGATAVAAALATFVGERPQVPPAFSAIKREGQPAYRAARRGQPLALAARAARAHSLTLTGFAAGQATAAGGPVATVDIECAKGYYVRALARDLGRALGVGAHVSALRRTAVGPFAAAEAVPLALAVARLEARDTDHVVHALDAVLTAWPAVLLGAEALRAARQGRAIDLDPFSGRTIEATTSARAYGPDGRLAALVRADPPRTWRPYRVFPT